MTSIEHGSQWRERFFDSTRGQIVMSLRQRAGTVQELAGELGLTDNAIRSHLASLERDGLVERAGARPGPSKSSITYTITSDAEQLFPKAYSPALSSLLATLEQRLDPDTRRDLLTEAGRRLAGSRLDSADLSEHAEHAARVLTGLGGLAGVEHRDGRIYIQGRSCPLLETAAERPDVCQLAAGLVEALTGVAVTICCQYNGRPRCCFEMAPVDSE